MKHIKKIKIDIDKRSFEVIPSVQYDSNTRFLHINLLNGSIPFDLTGCSVKISGTKQDGTAIFNNCTIINAKKGFVEVELTEQMNAVSGTLKCELKIYSANGVLTTKQFSIDITSSVTSKEITSSNEFKALTDALKIVQGIDNKVNNTEFNKLQEKINTFESEQIEGLNQAEVLALTSIATDNNGTTFPTPNARIEAIQINAYDDFSTSPLLHGYTYKVPLMWKKGINIAGTITDNYAGYFYSNVVSIEGDFHIELKKDYLIRVLKYVNGVYRSQTDYNGYKSIDIIKEPNTSYAFMIGKTVRETNLTLVTALNNFGIYAKKIDIEKSVPNLKNDTLLLTGYSTLGEIKTNWKLGAINGSGVESAYGKSIISDFFQIVNGISLVYDDSIYTCLLHEFNNNQTWIKSVTLNNDGFTKYYPKNPSNYYKVVFFKTVLENVTDITKLSQNLKLFKGYTPSFEYIKNKINKIEKTNLHSQGKTWNRVGDSITQQDRYTSYVVNNTGVIATKNMGLASSTIAINNSYMQNKSFVERVCGLNGNTAYGDADIWTVFGGINDYYINSPIGDINSTDNTTVYGALKQICENILNRSNYPKLILLTPLQSFYNTKPNKLGKYPIDYVNVVKDVAKYYSIPCVDLYSRGGLNAMNVQRANNPTTTDGLHPNDYGTKLWVGELVREINNLTYY